MRGDRWRALKIFLICCLIVISEGRSTTQLEFNDEGNDSDQYINEGDDGFDRYFNGGENDVDGKLQITENDLPKNGELFEGDMVMDNDLRRAVLGEESKKAAVIDAEVDRSRHWLGGVVPYVIDDSLIPAIRHKIPTACRVFKHFTSVRYVHATHLIGVVDYVRFSNGKGCSSNVGRKGGEQVIHLGKGCKRLGTIMHEMMHVLGIIHEQSRPDRDRYLKINFKNIKHDLLGNFQKYTIRQADTLNLPYNYNSVMHYSNHAFSKNDEDTLESKYDKNLSFGQRQMVTALDMAQINKLYPSEKDVLSMNKCTDFPCEGRRRCCLHSDMTPQEVLDDVERRKDARRNEYEWDNLLVNFLRPGDSV